MSADNLRAEDVIVRLIGDTFGSGYEFAEELLGALAGAGFAVVQLPEPMLVNPCGCHACNAKSRTEAQFMVLCPDCGCKRCPKATNHLHACTESNESGQLGSSYGWTCGLTCCSEYRAFVEARRREFDGVKAELEAVKATRASWPQWYCQVCGDADGDNAENCSDCNDYRQTSAVSGDNK